MAVSLAQNHPFKQHSRIFAHIVSLLADMGRLNEMQFRGLILTMTTFDASQQAQGFYIG